MTEKFISKTVLLPNTPYLVTGITSDIGKGTCSMNLATILRKDVGTVRTKFNQKVLRKCPVLDEFETRGEREFCLEKSPNENVKFFDRSTGRDVCGCKPKDGKDNGKCGRNPCNCYLLQMFE